MNKSPNVRPKHLVALALIVLSVTSSLWIDSATITRQYIELTLSDGTKASVAVYSPRGKPIGGALLLHGFSGSKENLALLACSLARAGYVVFAPDWRGHGATGGKLIGDAATILADVSVYSDALRSAYNLSFTLIGGHSMGGGFCQVAASELRPRYVVLMCSESMPNMTGPLLDSGTNVLLITASLDTVVSPESIVASASQTANVSVVPGTIHRFPGGGSILVALISNYDHLLVLYGEPLSAEVLSFIGSDASPPFLEVIASKIVAAILFVVGMIAVIPGSEAVAPSTTNQRQASTTAWLKAIAMYGCAGLLLPVCSAIALLIPGVGTSSFFIGLFLAIAVTIAAAAGLRAVRINVRFARPDVRSIGFGVVWGLLYVVGLHLIVGSDMIRLLPSNYGLVALVVTVPASAAFTFLDLQLLDTTEGRVPRWIVGIGTKVASFASSLGLIFLLYGSMAGFYLIFAYSALLMLVPLYIAESRFARRPELGRSASIAMFVVALSLLAAASGARI
ncbi:MAG TPA: alpha/beta fold hydrolase [Thermoproteota archaeon]|nr:alpha/beta fold hydrolase [Thermoproteota archaeon]